MSKQRPGKFRSRCFVELPPSGVRRDHLRQIPQLQFLFDRNDPKMRELAGVRAQDRRTQNMTAAMGYQLDHPLGTTLGLCAIVRRIWNADDLDVVAVFLARDFFHHADLCQFGIGVCYPGQGPVIDLSRHPEQRVPDHDTGVIGADMRKARSIDDVTSSIYAVRRCLQVFVDHDSFFIELDTCGLQTETSGARGLRQPADGIREAGWFDRPPRW